MVMALIFSNLSFHSSPSRSFSLPLSSSYSLSHTTSCNSSSTSPGLMNHHHPRSKLMEFPYVSAPHRNLMVDIVSKVEAHLSSSLLPCTLPQDVEYFENESGTAQSALLVRSAVPSSQVLALTCVYLLYHITVLGRVWLWLKSRLRLLGL